MRKRIIPISLFIYLSLVMIPNYILPVLSWFVKINYNAGIYQYIVDISSYLCIILLIWLDNDNLGEFHLDRISIFLLGIIGFIRSNLNIPGEIYYRILIYLLSLGILIAYMVNYRKIPKTKGRWVLIGIFSLLAIFPIAWINSLQTIYKTTPSVYKLSFLVSAVRNILYILSFVAPFEEIMIRGILWGELRRWGCSDSKTFWVQAILFWSLHIWQLFSTPLAFLVTLPIMILILSLLVRYSKQVFPSILVHTFADAIGPLIIQFFLR
jgi:membrane protease YdiL (CAAX protease family)